MKRRRSASRHEKQSQQQEQATRILEQKERRTFKPRASWAFPKSNSQRQYVEALNDPNNSIVFAVGPAGSGKTLLAVQWAIQSLQAGRIDKIIITRPAVSVDEDLGYLPGSALEKLEPWMVPIMDVFAEHYTKRDVKNMVENGVIETSPLSYMRGRTMKHAAVILDEAQNTTPSQMKMALTRLGEGARMVVTGDLGQADRPASNGLLDFLTKFRDAGPGTSSHIVICQFTSEDVERHEAVKDVLRVYGDL